MLSHMDKKYIEDLINLFFDRLDQSLQNIKTENTERYYSEFFDNRNSNENVESAIQNLKTFEEAMKIIAEKNNNFAE